MKFRNALVLTAILTSSLHGFADESAEGLNLFGPAAVTTSLGAAALVYGSPASLRFQETIDNHLHRHSAVLAPTNNPVVVDEITRVIPDGSYVEVKTVISDEKTAKQIITDQKAILEKYRTSAKEMALLKVVEDVNPKHPSVIAFYERLKSNPLTSQYTISGVLKAQEAKIAEAQKSILESEKAFKESKSIVRTEILEGYSKAELSKEIKNILNEGEGRKLTQVRFVDAQTYDSALKKLGHKGLAIKAGARAMLVGAGLFALDSLSKAAARNVDSGSNEQSDSVRGTR